MSSNDDTDLPALVEDDDTYPLLVVGPLAVLHAELADSSASDNLQTPSIAAAASLPAALVTADSSSSLQSEAPNLHDLYAFMTTTTQLGPWMASTDLFFQFQLVIPHGLVSIDACKTFRNN